MHAVNTILSTNDFNLSVENFCLSIENIDRACSTFLENNMAIFLPYKRIDKTDIQPYFFKNNQVLQISTDNNHFSMVEIHGRLLGQTHKDILEILLSLDKSYSQKNKAFSVTTNIASITKLWMKNYGRKKWIISKIKEIADCSINLYFKTDNNKQIDFKMNFISSSIAIDGKNITVNFTQEYTYFMAKTELLDYSLFVPDIVRLDNDFTKAIVRFILKDNGVNTRYKLETILQKLNYRKLMSSIELVREIKIFKSPKIQKILKNKFGIYLSKNDETINFDISLIDKKRYFIKPKEFNV